MEIRRLTQSDFYELRNLLDGVFSRHNGRNVQFAQGFPRLFGEANSYAAQSHLGAFIDGKLVGTAAMYPLDYVVGDKHIRLIANGNIAVDEAYRGQGVMSALLEAVNAETDKCGDVGYLHGSAVRYGRVGYVAGGVEYRLTVQPGEETGYTFRPVVQEDVTSLNKLWQQKTDYILREDGDFISALRSGGREAVAVQDQHGALVGYVSLHRVNGHVEEYAFCGGLEPEIFPQIARDLGRSVTVTVSGYDPAAAERCKAVAEIKQRYPALFRIIHPEVLQEAALALGLDEAVYYAPYLT